MISTAIFPVSVRACRKKIVRGLSVRGVGIMTEFPITMIIAIGQFAFTVGGISFNGIAIGTIVILVAYHGLKAIGKATGTIAKDDPDIL